MRRAGIAETDFVELNRFLELRQPRRARTLLDLLIAIQIFENFLRRAQRLLEDIVDAGQPFHRLIQHQQRHHEADEFAGAHRAAL